MFVLTAGLANFQIANIEANSPRWQRAMPEMPAEVAAALEHQSAEGLPAGWQKTGRAVKDILAVMKEHDFEQAMAMAKSLLVELEAEPETERARSEVLGQIGYIHLQMDEDESDVEAMRAFKAAETLLAETLGADSAFTLIATERVADAYDQTGSPQQALFIYRNMLDKLSDAPGVRPRYRSILSKLGGIAGEAGKPKVGVYALRKLLTLLVQDLDDSRRIAAEGNASNSSEESEASALARQGEAEGIALDLPDDLAKAERAVARAHVRLGRALLLVGASSRRGRKREDALNEALEHAHRAKAAYDAGMMVQHKLEHARCAEDIAVIFHEMGREEEAVSAMVHAAVVAANEDPDSLLGLAQDIESGLDMYVYRRQQLRGEVPKHEPEKVEGVSEEDALSLQTELRLLGERAFGSPGLRHV